MPLASHAESGRAQGWVPLPGSGEAAQTGRAARADGVRRVRRMSNWTAAALVVGAGAATVALAHNAFPVSAPATATAGTAVGAGTNATAASATGGPQVSHSVATTSGSSVVVTTTTHTASGKVVVTHVRHAAAYHDN